MAKKLLSIILALVTVCFVTVSASAASTYNTDVPNGNTVTIYTTNDIHGVTEESSTTIGLPQTAGIVASTENALLVDAGDATQGASFATITQGADVIKMMNAAGYDLMTVGNHEFDYGAERLLANVESADFPVLSANVLLNGSPMLEQNTIITVGEYKIGFIGITTTATATSTNPAQLEGITFTDEIETAKEQIEKLSDSTDAIILVCHLGDNASAVKCTSADLLKSLSSEQLSKVTAVVDGHSHTVEKGVFEGTQIPVIQTGTGFTSLGAITLTFDENGVSATGKVMSREEAMNFALTSDGENAKALVENTLAGIKAEQDSILKEKLCTNETPLWGGYIYYDYAEPRIVETSYGDFVTDAFAASAKIFAEQQGIDLPVIAVENGGGISAALPFGEVTKGDVLNAFNHGNMVEVLKVTPSQLYEAVEKGLVTTGQDDTGLLLRERVSGSFLQVSGFSYTYDPAAESGTKVTSINLDNGTELKRDDTTSYLILATNNYVSASSFKNAEKLGELGGEDMIVEDYISTKTENGTAPLSVPTCANRIKIENDRSPASYDVVIPIIDSTADVNERKYVPENKIVLLKIDNGEYKEYVTNVEGSVNLTLEKGPHTIYMDKASDNRPVYVNNYSGSGTVTTNEGYYRLAFSADPNDLENKSEESSDPVQPESSEESSYETESKPNESEAESKPNESETESVPSESEAGSVSNVPETSSNPDKPATGESSEAVIMVALLIVSAASLTLVLSRRKKSI